ncbi:MAG: MFS transporter [Sciscionella sp.]
MTELADSPSVLAGLGPSGRRAFVASGAGWALDSYDYQIFPLGLVAISATFGLSQGQAGWISTVTLLVSVLGGVLAGALADRIGRVRTLMVVVATYSVFTFLCGFAPNYETLLVFRALEGLGFGGEWAAGAILIAEYAKPESRGRLLGMIQSSWAIGWAVAVLVYIGAFGLLPREYAWRALFWVGLAPALLLLLYIRRGVPEPEVCRRGRTRCCWCSAFRSGSSRPGCSPDLAPTSPSCTRAGLGARVRVSVREQIADLLVAVRARPWFPTRYAALPIAGNADRLTGGTLVFSLVENNFLVSGSSMQQLEDAVTVRLADHGATPVSARTWSAPDARLAEHPYRWGCGAHLRPDIEKQVKQLGRQ